MDCMFANEESSMSGCESGWTLYFEHSSSISPYANSYNIDQENNDGFVDDGRKNEEVTGNRLLEEDEEDLSMVSDASSGPPHFHEDEEQERGYGYGGSSNVNHDTNRCFYHYHQINNININNDHHDPLLFKNREKRRRNVQDHSSSSSLLDDTASSAFSDFSSDKSLSLITRTRRRPSVENHVLEYSQGYSSTQSHVRPPYQEQYDFFRSENQLQQNKLSLKAKGGDAMRNNKHEREKEMTELRFS